MAEEEKKEAVDEDSGDDAQDNEETIAEAL